MSVTELGEQLELAVAKHHVSCLCPLPCRQGLEEAGTLSSGARAGFKDLHSFAFLGGSGRIGTAQDGIYAYVPAGPHKQFDMLLHSYAAYKAGRMKAWPLGVGVCCLPSHNI